MENTLIIYPHDDTTSFLLESFQFLQKKLPSIIFYEIYPNDESHENCKRLISMYHNIIFMGHGSSQKLSGSKNESYHNDSLISQQEIKALNKKNWILFSCNSNDLLKRCNNDIEYGIGFGDLPTDMNDIRGIREFDSMAYLNINEEVIVDFRESINWIISNSILKLIEADLTIEELFNFIKILITKRMIDIFKDYKNTNQKEHAKLLFDMKEESIFINN